MKNTENYPGLEMAPIRPPSEAKSLLLRTWSRCFGGKGAEAVADQLEAGMIGVNQGVGGSGDTPWAGAKQSGFGFHRSSVGHRQFAQLRVVSR